MATNDAKPTDVQVGVHRQKCRRHRNCPTEHHRNLVRHRRLQTDPASRRYLRCQQRVHLCALIGRAPVPLRVCGRTYCNLSWLPPWKRGLGSRRLGHGSRRDRLSVEVSQEAVGRVGRPTYADSNRRNRLYGGHSSRCSSAMSIGQARSKGSARGKMGCRNADRRKKGEFCPVRSYRGRSRLMRFF